MALVVVLVVNLLFVLLVLSRDYKKLQNILYGVMILLLIIWTTLNYLTNHVDSYEAQLLVNRLSFASALILVISVWTFSIYFPRKIKNHPIQRMAALLTALPIFFLMITSSYMVGAVNYDANRGVTDVVSGPLFPLYTIGLILFLTFLVKNFYNSYKSKTNDSLGRQQIIYTAAGIIFTFVWSLVTATLWPMITGDWAVSKLSIIGSLFLGSFIGIAIIKHKLFDIRLIVARSMGYILSLGLLGVIASFILFVASGYLERLGLDNNFLRLFYVVVAIVLAIVYQPTKRFFDKVTNKLFYRDAYDTKELLDSFNQAIVSTIELEKLLAKSAGVIEQYLRPEFCAFALLDEHGNIRVLHAQNSKVTDKLVDQMRGYIAKDKNKIVLTDMLETGQTDLKALLGQEDIAVVARITKSSNAEGVGYMILGNKKSGTIYNSQDTDNMEIVTNELAIAIENALQYEEIQNFAKTLEGKVEEATRDLRKANEKLKQLDQTKDDFISMASHQLRTPLTSVKGYVSMVLEGDTGKITSKQRELLDQAFVSSQRMVYLIADLLNVSRLRTGKFIIEAKPTNLADVVEGEIKQLIETAKGRNLELTYTKPKSFPTLMLDDTKIRQVIMNFADNAIYYTPSGGHIKVGLEDKGETVEFTVTDDGLGVPKSEQHHLFNKFYRASNAKKARPDGTGLGLFMAKKVIVAQGGAIIFTTQEGKGSTFGFSFAKKPLLPEHYKGPITEEKSAQK